MVIDDGRWSIVYNGELYNYRELRRELESHGVKFRSESDTEVLLRACDHWGVVEALVRANGQFAFGLWNEADRQLWLARDRFDVQLIPFTVEHTNLKQAKVRDRVNLECDMVGKYVARAVELAARP